MLGITNPMPRVRALGAENLSFLGSIVGGHAVLHWYQQLFPVVLPSIKSGMGLNDVQVGALSSARQLVAGGLELPSGILADSLVRHRAIILASALVFMGVAYLLVGLSPSFIWALPAAGLVGLGSVTWHPTALSSISTRFPRWRASALGLHGMGATFSDTITPLAVGGLLAVFHWRNVLEFQMVPALLAALVIWRALSGSFRSMAAGQTRRPRFGEMATLAKQPVFLGFVVAQGLMQMGRIIVLTFLPIYLQEHLGYSPFVLGVSIALLHGMGIISQQVLAVLSDRYGRKAVLFPSFLALAALYTLIWAVDPGFQLWLVITATGIFFYTLVNVTGATIFDMAPPHIQATSLGMADTITHVGVLPAPIIAGVLIGAYGIGSAFLFAGGLLFLAALVILPLPLYRGNRSASD